MDSAGSDADTGIASCATLHWSFVSADLLFTERGTGRQLLAFGLVLVTPTDSADSAEA